MREAPLSALPGISPSRGEIGIFSAGHLLATLAIGKKPARQLISTLEGEMSGRTERGAKELGLS
jgi:hypothetical protein